MVHFISRHYYKRGGLLKALKSAVTAYFFDLSCNIIIDEYYKLTKHLSSQGTTRLICIG